MARPLQAHLPLPSSASFSNNTTLLLLLLLVAAVAAISSMIMFLCTTHKHSKMSRGEGWGSKPKSPPQSDHNLFSTISGNISSKALVVAKLLSWKKGEVDDEEAVWKKTIIMGEKCRPLDFSGQILYDSEGNQVAELPPKSHGGHSGALGA